MFDLRYHVASLAAVFLALIIGILVDAKGVSRLVSRRVGIWPLVAFALAGFGAIVTAVLASPQLRHVINLVSLRVQSLLGIQ